MERYRKEPKPAVWGSLRLSIDGHTPSLTPLSLSSPWVRGSFGNSQLHGLFRSLLPALSCIQTALLHLLDMGWEPSDLTFFVDIQLPDLLMKMSQDNISAHDSVIR